jgi:hypothetical protein
MAASYAAAHGEQLSGVYLLAAYANRPLDPDSRAFVIYGSEDGVLNRVKLEAGNRNLPEHSATCVIEGGNHAQFGNYGAQKGDGEAVISAQEQQEETIRFVMDVIKDREGNR